MAIHYAIDMVFRISVSWKDLNKICEQSNAPRIIARDVADMHISGIFDHVPTADEIVKIEREIEHADVPEIEYESVIFSHYDKCEPIAA